MMGRAQRPRRGVGRSRCEGDAGDTLLEILLTVAVVSITAVALLTAFATAIGASARHKTLSANSVALRDVSEVVFSQIQQQLKYVSCATSYTSANSWGAPSGYSASVTTIQYWNGSGWSSSCTTGSTQPELLTTTVTSPSGVTAMTQLVVMSSTSTGTSSAVTVVTATPSTLSQGQSNQTVTLTGTGFKSGATATFSGSGVTATATYVSSTTLTLSVTVASNATEGLRSITVTNPDATTGTSGLIFNVAGTVTQFLVTPSTSTVAAGTGFTVTLAAEDSTGALVTSYTGTVNVTWSGAFTSPGGNAPSYPTSTVTFFDGYSTTTLTATLYGAGSNTLTASSGGASGFATITVTAGTVSGYKMSAPPSATAGTQFSGVTVTIVDIYGNATSGSSPTCNLTFSGASNSPGGNAPSYPNGNVSFSNGVSTTTLKFTLYDAQTAVLRATSATGGSCPSSTVVAASVSVGAAAGTTLTWTSYSWSINCSGPGGSSPVTTIALTGCGHASASTFTSSVELLDSYGNAATTASAITVALGSGGVGSSSPTSVTIASGASTSGSFTYTVTFQNGNGLKNATLTASKSGYTSATLTMAR
jgi:hypothetical protein